MRVVLIWEFGFREYYRHSVHKLDFGLQRVSGQRNCLACFQSIARGSASCVSQLVTAAMAGMEQPLQGTSGTLQLFSAMIA
jgi:hypothetical protein